MNSATEYIANQEQISGSIYYLLRTAIELVSLYQYTYVAVCTHRIVILGDNSVPEWGLRRYTSREGIFFFYSLVITILGYLLMSVGEIVENAWITLIAWLFVVYIMVRFSLIFPACAVDQYISLKQSWEYTQNKFLFMLMATFIWPFLLAIPVFLMIMGLMMAGSSILAITGVIVKGILGVLLTILFISSLSMAYVRIVNKTNKGVEVE